MELSGTSFAAPVVSGMAADLLGVHPDWTPDQVKGAIMRSATAIKKAAPLSVGVGEVDIHEGARRQDAAAESERRARTSSSCPIRTAGRTRSSTRRAG